MKSHLFTPVALVAFAVAAPAQANDPSGNASWKAQSPEVVERNAQGKATKVRIGDAIYEVCMSDTQDNCINPRAAGLNWGDKPLDYWPGNRRS